MKADPNAAKPDGRVQPAQRPAAAMPDIPESIGKFRVEGMLGRGAMGVVYKALDPDIERTVAIKLVRTDLLESDDRAHYMSRFRNEAKMVGRCIHPNIVGIHDFSMHEGNPFLVLEFVEGQNLGRAFRRGTQIDLPIAGNIALEVLKALSYAHGFGVIHRDVKPANILLTKAAAIKVTDFGISRAFASDATMSSVLVGTPCYMSPEQCLGGAVDARSDLFSMGSVLYEMLSGRRCFDAPNFLAATHKILHQHPEPLGALRPDLPAAVVEVVETALAKRPEDRFQSAAEMEKALRRALFGSDALAAGQDSHDATLSTTSADRICPAKRPAAELEALQGASLATMERRLAHYLGPMAGFHLRKAVREARTPEELGQLLAEFIPEEPAREQVRADLLKIIASDSGLAMLRSRAGTLPGGMGLPTVTIDAAAKVLTLIMGPVAPHLLRRALLTAKTPAELEATCVEMIDPPEERDRFRKLLANATQAR